MAEPRLSVTTLVEQLSTLLLPLHLSNTDAILQGIIQEFAPTSLGDLRSVTADKFHAIGISLADAMKIVSCLGHEDQPDNKEPVRTQQVLLPPEQASRSTFISSGGRLALNEPRPPLPIRRVIAPLFFPMGMLQFATRCVYSMFGEEEKTIGCFDSQQSPPHLLYAGFPQQYDSPSPGRKSLPACTETKTDIRLLVLGKTGAGKSTFINALFNHIQRVKYEDPKYYIIPCDGHKCNVAEYVGHSMEAGDIQAQSQTQKCFTYVFENTAYKVKLIDTPGFGDTRGIEQDEKNIKDILQEIDKHADFNALCLVIPTSDFRVDSYYKYYLKAIQTMLPADCQNSFLVCLTHGLGNPQAPLRSLQQMGINTTNFFQFENQGLNLPIDSDNPYQRMVWEINQQAYLKLLNKAAMMPAFSTKKFRELARQRCFFTVQLQEQISRLLTLETERAAAKQHIDIIQELSEKKKVNEDYEIEIDLITSVPDNTGPKDTYCVDCKTICHKNCQLPELFIQTGDKHLLKCYCMNKDRCTNCKCLVDTHVHQGYRFIETHNKERKTITSKKQAFQEASQNIILAEEALKEAQDNISGLEDQVQYHIQIIANHYWKMKALSLLPYNDAYEEYIELTIRNTEKEPLSPERTEKLDRLQKMSEHYKKRKELVRQMGENPPSI